MLNLASQTEFLGSFADCTRRQIEIDLVNDLTKMTFHVRHNYCLRQAFSIGFIASVVLDLNV